MLFAFRDMAAATKWVLCAAALLFPFPAALSLSDAAAAANIPSVPKVQNADADGFPVLPNAESLLQDVSRAVQGLRHETITLQEELQNEERQSHVKVNKQKAAYDQLLKKQEQTNQQIQALNTERAKEMLKIRETARKTKAKIKKEEEANSNQRSKLKALQKRLVQAQKATEDALGDHADASAGHEEIPQQEPTQDDVPSTDEISSGSAADAPMIEEKPARRSLSFLEVRQEVSSTETSSEKSDAEEYEEEDGYESDTAAPTQSKAAVKKAVASAGPAAVTGKRPDANSQPPQSPGAGNPAKDFNPWADKPLAAKHKPIRSLSSIRPLIAAKASTQKTVQRAQPEHATTEFAEASQDTPTSWSSTPEETTSDDQQLLLEEAGDAAEPDKAQDNLFAGADDQTQVLHEGASSSEGMVASLTQGVKRIQDEVQRGEAQLKLDFQKAYKAGKKRHAALVKQSKALDKSLHSMQLQEERLETALAKVWATGKTLKHKIQAIGGILNGAASPIGVPHEVSEKQQ